MKPLWMITISPELELFSKLCIRHNVSDIKIRNRSKVIDDVFEHWLTRYVEKRFRSRQSKRIKTGCVAGGQNDQLHKVSFQISNLRSQISNMNLAEGLLWNLRSEI